jgi:hypothetical protein
MEKLTPRGQKERFQHLLAYLTRLNEEEPEVFSLTHWMAGKHAHKAVASWVERASKGEPLNCGTTACVVGHLPVAFPDDFSWNSGEVIQVVYRGSVLDQWGFAFNTRSAVYGLSEYFGGAPGEWDSIIYMRGYEDYKDGEEIPLWVVLKKMEALYAQVHGS